jgi:hypothetical protein
MTRDLRKYARQTNVRLIVGALLVLLLIGDGLIYLLYGSGAAVTGLLCIGIGLTPVLLVLLFLFVLDWITKRANGE